MRFRLCPIYTIIPLKSYLVCCYEMVSKPIVACGLKIWQASWHMGFGMYHWGTRGWTANIPWLKLNGSIILNPQSLWLVARRTNKNNVKQPKISKFIIPFLKKDRAPLSTIHWQNITKSIIIYESLPYIRPCQQNYSRVGFNSPIFNLAKCVRKWACNLVIN